jgi:hypothetical protein
MKIIPLVIAGAFPIAGVWMLAFMAAFAIVLLPIFPFILRRRRKKEQAALHIRIAKAKAAILADGIVEGPKGPRFRHRARGSRGRSPTNDAGPPRHNAYDGGPWQ